MEENPKIFMIERFRLQKSCWLVKVINTATGGEALILSSILITLMVLFAFESLFYHKALKFHGYNFQIEKSTDVVLCGWILLSINEHMAAYSLYLKTELCIVI